VEARALCYVADATATAALIDAARDEHWRVRMNAVRALGIIGDAEAQTGVIAAGRDAHARVRAAAITALGSLGGDDAFDLLTRLVADPDARGHRSSGGRPGKTGPLGSLERLDRRALPHHGVPYRLVMVAIEEVDVREHVLLPGLAKRVGPVGVNHQTCGETIQH
jgi:hypothetical protein